MTEGKRNIIQGLLQEYDIETAQDIHETLKDLLGITSKKRWKQKWMNICDIPNRNARTVMITVTAIRPTR